MKFMRILVLVLIINATHIQAMQVISRREQRAVQVVGTCLFVAVHAVCFPNAAQDITDATAHCLSHVLPSSTTIISSLSQLSEWIKPAIKSQNGHSSKDLMPDREWFTFPWGDIH